MNAAASPIAEGVADKALGMAMPPVSLKLNEPAVDRLSALISGWALAGLAQANAHGSPS
jgi:hypothetical protein